MTEHGHSPSPPSRSGSCDRPPSKERPWPSCVAPHKWSVFTPSPLRPPDLHHQQPSRIAYEGPGTLLYQPIVPSPATIGRRARACWPPPRRAPGPGCSSLRPPPCWPACHRRRCRPSRSQPARLIGPADAATSLATLGHQASEAVVANSPPTSERPGSRPHSHRGKARRSRPVPGHPRARRQRKERPYPPADHQARLGHPGAGAT